PPTTRRARALLVLLTCGLLLSSCSRPPDTAPTVSAAAPETPAEATPEQVHQFCGSACHPYPPADTFPRATWRREIKQAFDFFRNSKLQIDFPSQESVALYYERRAPVELPLLKNDKPAHELPVKFQRKD